MIYPKLTQQTLLSFHGSRWNCLRRDEYGFVVVQRKNRADSKEMYICNLSFTGKPQLTSRARATAPPQEMTWSTRNSDTKEGSSTKNRNENTKKMRQNDRIRDRGLKAVLLIKTDICLLRKWSENCAVLGMYTLSTKWFIFQAAADSKIWHDRVKFTLKL